MKHIGNKNLSEITPSLVFRILGYAIYVPMEYRNPRVFLKKKCPIWLNYNEDGECDVFESDGRDVVYQSLVGLIKKIYPKRNGYYCQPLSKELAIQFTTSCEGLNKISSVCFDENDTLLALVLVKTDEKMSLVEGVECGIIETLWSASDTALGELSNYFFSEEMINAYRSMLVCFYPKTESDSFNARLFGLCKSDDDCFRFQLE